MQRLNLGCGGQVPPDWVNVDRVGDPPILVHDLRAPWPFDDDEFDYAVAHHVLDLFEWAGLEHVLTEARRVIRPGGAIRVSLADVKRAIGAAETGEYEWFTMFDDGQTTGVWELAQRFITLGGARRLFLPRKAIAGALRGVGFSDVGLVNPGNTHYGPEHGIVALDTRLGESFFLEAR